MRLFNDEQILGLQHGVEQGLTNNGFELSDRDQLMIMMTVKTMVETFEKILED